MSDLASALDGLSLAETAAETDSTIIVIDNLNDCATRIGAMIEKLRSTSRASTFAAMESSA